MGSGHGHIPLYVAYNYRALTVNGNKNGAGFGRVHGRRPLGFQPGGEDFMEWQPGYRRGIFFLTDSVGQAS